MNMPKTTFWARFRRVTRDGRWIPEIDGLRFLAILSVFLFHFFGEIANRAGHPVLIQPRYQRLFEITNTGDRGVGIFFVISGWIVALPFARHFLAGSKPVSLRKYFLRRITRLEPPYLLAVLLFLVLFTFYQGGLTGDTLRHALASATYSHSLIYATMTPINPVSWSLEVEIGFYILAPIIMLLYAVRGKLLRRGIFVALIALISAAQYWSGHPSPRVELSIAYSIQYFLAGLLVADIHVLSLDAMRPGFLWDAVCIFAVLANFATQAGTQYMHALLPFVNAALGIGALRSIAVRRFFANEAIATIGGMCYSIYLMHFMWMAVFFKITRRLMIFNEFGLNALVQMVTLVPLVLLVSAMFYKFVEQPCMDPAWPAKLWARLTGHPRAEAKELDASGVS